MNGQHTALGGQALDLRKDLVVTEHTGEETLQECVRQAMKHYLAQMGDHTPTDLYKMVLNEVEAPLLRTVMEHAGDNQTKAATMLGISRSTLRNKLAKYRLD